jgi:hypothetical protein
MTPNPSVEHPLLAGSGRFVYPKLFGSSKSNQVVFAYLKYTYSIALNLWHVVHFFIL